MSTKLATLNHLGRSIKKLMLTFLRPSKGEDILIIELEDIV